MILILGGTRPELTFDHEFSQDCDILYKDVFGMTALWLNISTDIEEGKGNRELARALSWE